MKDVLSLAWKLLAITLIAGILLSVTYAITKESIEQQAIKEATLARQEVLPEAQDFELLDAELDAEKYGAISEVYVGKDASGNIIGATFKMVLKGYSAGLNLTVGVAEDGTVTGVKVGSNEETPGLGAKATESAFQDQFKGLTVGIEVVKNNPQGNQIQALTGATITSRAVTQGVNMACDCYSEYIGQ